MDLIPSLRYLNLFVDCPSSTSANPLLSILLIEDLPTTNDDPLIIFQLTSKPLAKDHVSKVVEYYPRAQETAISVHLHTRPNFRPTSTNFQIPLNVPQDIVRDIEGMKTRSNISGTLPLMLLISGLPRDHGSTPIALPSFPLPNIRTDPHCLVHRLPQPACRCPHRPRDQKGTTA